MDMHFLISNDDGISAIGIRVLADRMRQLGKVTIVAPDQNRSGASNSLTLDSPIRIKEVETDIYSVSGTPTDCVHIALTGLLAKDPHMVISGINFGANLGDDVIYSGTVAAAMEGALLGIPSIALSQHTTHIRHTKWATAEHFAPDLICRLVAAGWPSNVLINVNFPDVAEDKVKGVAVSIQGRRKPGSKLDKRHDPRGRPYYWICSARTEQPSLKGSDLAAIYGGKISVTPLHLDLTHRATCKSLRAALE